MGSFRQRPLDFERHNAEVRRVWAAFEAHRPYRVPVILAGSIRNLFGNPALNTTGFTFEDFFENPQAQIACQLAYQKWWRHNVVCDQELGPPAQGWQLGIDFQNSYEAGWMGCPLRYFGNGVPDTVEILKEKRKLYDMAPPDPLRGNLLGRAMEFFEYMQAECPRMEFEGRPVRPPVTIPGEGTDGPFDLAYKLRGAAEVCLDLYEDPAYVHDLMTFITDNIIRRMRAIRAWRRARQPAAPDTGGPKPPYWWFADDAIAMLSTDAYREFIWPYHRRLVDAFSDGVPVAIHLCGDATHHFKFLRDNLNVRAFDTGFPVDFGKLRRELGPEVLIQGGPTVMRLKDGTPDTIRADVQRICASGIMDGGRFVLREANNLAPCTPLENLDAFYEAGKMYGAHPQP